MLTRQAGRSPATRTTSASARTTWPPRRRASIASSCSRTRRASTGSIGPATPGRPSSAPTRRASPASSSRYDVKTGKNRPIWGMGRHNHENSVPIPGFDDLVLLSGDDTFTNNPSQSQLYSYIAPNADAVWNDEGALWAFQSTRRQAEVRGLRPGDATSVTGPVHPGPAAHRDRPQSRRDRPDGRATSRQPRRAVPAAAQ